jgi:hypothetical protein
MRDSLTRTCSAAARHAASRASASPSARSASALDQGREAIRLAAGDLGGHAGFFAPGPRGRGIALGDGELGTDVVVPQFEQHLPGFHAVALLHRQLRDLAACRRCKFGALAGLHRARTRVGDGLRDRAAAHLDHFDGNRLRTAEPQPGADGHDREAGKDPDRAPLHAVSPAASA